MDQLTKGWVHHLRKTARQTTAGQTTAGRTTAGQMTAGHGSCPLCDAEIQPDLDSFKAHVRADATGHSSLADDADIERAFQKVTIHSPQYVPPPFRSRRRQRIDHGDVHICNIGVPRLLQDVHQKQLDPADRTGSGRPLTIWISRIDQTRARA